MISSKEIFQLSILTHVFIGQLSIIDVTSTVLFYPLITQRAMRLYPQSLEYALLVKRRVPTLQPQLRLVVHQLLSEPLVFVCDVFEALEVVAAYQTLVDLHRLLLALFYVLEAGLDHLGQLVQLVAVVHEKHCASNLDDAVAAFAIFRIGL